MCPSAQQARHGNVRKLAILRTVDLRKAWESEARNWARWARTPEHDFYWNFGRQNLLELLPPPGRRTLDLGCGEGRLARDLEKLGHRVVGVDSSPTLITLATEASPELEFVLADASALPFGDAEFDLVVAYMSLMDIDDMPGAVREAARVLERGGCFCFATVHPVNSAGSFGEETSDSAFVIEGSYLSEHRYSDVLEREGLAMTFHSAHRPLETYARALETAGFVVEAIREPPTSSEVEREERTRRWRRIPCFLYVRARKS